MLAVTAARLFDGQRLSPLRRPAVLIDGATILDVVERASLPEQQPVLELGDATLLPGLVDTHTHLAFDASMDPTLALAELSDEQLGELIAGNARQALAAGITSARDLGDREFATLALAERARQHPAAGPTLVCSGPPLTSPGGHCHFLGGAFAGPVELEAAVRRWAARGVNLIKVMVTGGNLTPGSDGLNVQFDAAELRAIVDTAHELGLIVTAHAHAAEGVRAAVLAGVDGLEHAKFWSADGISPDWSVIDLILERRIAVCPTLGALPGAPPPPPAVARRSEQAAALVGELARLGANLIAGSDAGISPAKPHDLLPYSIGEMGRCGLSNPQALHSATRAAALACGLAAKGSLAPGFDADLIAVAGNPVADLAALHQVSAVFRAGQQVLPERRKALV